MKLSTHQVLAGILLTLSASACSTCRAKDHGAPDAGASAEPTPDASAAAATDTTDAAAAAASATPSATAVASTTTPAPAGGPFAAGQKWQGSYTCGTAKPTSLALNIKSVSGSAVTAEFDFQTNPDKKQGQFTMAGTLAGNHLHLSFGKWIRQPPGFVPADLDGNVTADGKAYSGAVIAPSASCKTFSVRR
jgi:hypothetical protein